LEGPAAAAAATAGHWPLQHEDLLRCCTHTNLQLVWILSVSPTNAGLKDGGVIFVNIIIIIILFLVVIIAKS
jgi:hypothetical protein